LPYETGVLIGLTPHPAMATTAIGTLIPILRDNGELKTRFGTYLLAAGGAGEFGPILLVTLVIALVGWKLPAASLQATS